MPQSDHLNNAHRTSLEWQVGKAISVDQVNLFFMYTRRHFDGAPKSKEFPILKTYMDWFQHTELTYKNHAHLLKSFTIRLNYTHQSFGITESHPDYGTVFAEYALGMKDLAEELSELFAGYGNHIFGHANPSEFQRFAKCMMLCLKGFELMCGDQMFMANGNVNKKRQRELFPDSNWFPVSLQYEVFPNTDDRFPNRLVAQFSYYDCKKEIFITQNVNIAAINQDGDFDDRKIAPLPMNRSRALKPTPDYNPLQSFRGFSVIPKRK